VGRCERRNGNARIHASRSGTGHKSLFEARRLGSGLLAAKKCRSSEKSIFSGVSTKKKDLSGENTLSD
jgi:hypothetical protein